VGEAIDQIRPSAAAKNIELRLRCDKVTINVEPTLLRRSIVNLLDNAVKFSPVSGTIKIILQKMVKGFELKIVDQGPGIPENLKEKIFEPFYRVDKKRENPTSGYGLGLSIARWVVQLHNGDIHVTNDEKGCEFVIRFSQ
jgi:signal transduction histidine kinase